MSLCLAFVAAACALPQEPPSPPSSPRASAPSPDTPTALADRVRADAAGDAALQKLAAAPRTWSDWDAAEAFIDDVLAPARGAATAHLHTFDDGAATLEIAARERVAEAKAALAQLEPRLHRLRVPQPSLLRPGVYAGHNELGNNEVVIESRGPWEDGGAVRPIEGPFLFDGDSDVRKGALHYLDPPADVLAAPAQAAAALDALEHDVGAQHEALARDLLAPVAEAGKALATWTAEQREARVADVVREMTATLAQWHADVPAKDAPLDDALATLRTTLQGLRDATAKVRAEGRQRIADQSQRASALLDRLDAVLGSGAADHGAAVEARAPSPSQDAADDLDAAVRNAAVSAWRPNVDALAAAVATWQHTALAQAAKAADDAVQALDVARIEAPPGEGLAQAATAARALLADFDGTLAALQHDAEQRRAAIRARLDALLADLAAGEALPGREALSTDATEAELAKKLAAARADARRRIGARLDALLAAQPEHVVARTTLGDSERIADGTDAGDGIVVLADGGDRLRLVGLADDGRSGTLAELPTPRQSAFGGRPAGALTLQVDGRRALVRHLQDGSAYLIDLATKKVRAVSLGDGEGEVTMVGDAIVRSERPQHGSDVTLQVETLDGTPLPGWQDARSCTTYQVQGDKLIGDRLGGGEPADAFVYDLTAHRFVVDGLRDRTPAPIDFAITAAGDLLALLPAAASGPQVARFDVSRGVYVTEVHLPATPLSMGHTAGRVVVLLRGDGRVAGGSELAAFDLGRSDAPAAWRTPLTLGANVVRVVAVHDAAFLLGDDGSVACFDAGTGKPRWHATDAFGKDAVARVQVLAADGGWVLLDRNAVLLGYDDGKEIDRLGRAGAAERRAWLRRHGALPGLRAMPRLPATPVALLDADGHDVAATDVTLPDGATVCLPDTKGLSDDLRAPDAFVLAAPDRICLGRRTLLLLR